MTSAEPPNIADRDGRDRLSRALDSLPYRAADDALLASAARAYLTDHRSDLRVVLGHILSLPNVTGEGTEDDELIIAAVKRLTRAQESDWTEWENVEGGRVRRRRPPDA